MSNIRNLVGKFLYRLDLKRNETKSVAELSDFAVALAQDAIVDAENAATHTSHNCASVLPEKGSVLTHSYSNTVYKAFELAAKTGKDLRIYVTESRPGLEGRRLSKDLAAQGLAVTLIADSAAASMLQESDLVLVGADSVLADGSIVHKVGTKAIAIAAHAEEIPFYVGTETTKFSVEDFLGEPPRIHEMDSNEILDDIKDPLIGARNVYFDVTPGKYVSGIVTEGGILRPSEVAGNVKRMLNEIYP